jgi:hypothetical protein
MFMGKLEDAINSASPWLIIVTSPILTSIQLSRGYWPVDLTLWLMMIGITVQFLRMLGGRWGIGALTATIGLALTWLGRVGLVFNYFIVTNGLYQLIGAGSWGPAPGSLILASIMTTGFELYGVGLVAMAYIDHGGVAIGDVLMGFIDAAGAFMVKYSYLFAFLIPFIVRMIPELVSWPWFVGYDTPEYTATLMDYLIKPTFFTYTRWYGGPNALPPLLFLLLYPVAHLVSPWLIFKFNDAVLLGLLGVSMNFMLRRMGFNQGDALIASLISTLYPTMFTLSWEFAMLMLGLVMLLLTMAVMHLHVESHRRYWLPLLALTVLSALAHQVSATLTALIFISYFAVKDRDPRWLGLALIGVAADAFYTNFTMLTVTHTQVGLSVSSSLVYSSGIPPYQAIEGYLIQLVVAYWPLLILVSHNWRRGNFILYTLLLWLLVILLPSGLMPSSSFVSWWIWALTLPIALAPLATRPRALSAALLAVLVLLDIAWSWSSIVNYVIPSIGPEVITVQGPFSRACVTPLEEGFAYEAGVYVAHHLNGTYVTDYCLYTFIHLADRFGRGVVVSDNPLDMALSLNGTVYLVTTQYLSNYTMVARFGEGVVILPYNRGVAYPVYIFKVKG